VSAQTITIIVGIYLFTYLLTYLLICHRFADTNKRTNRRTNFINYTKSYYYYYSVFNKEYVTKAHNTAALIDE